MATLSTVNQQHDRNEIVSTFQFHECHETQGTAHTNRTTIKDLFLEHQTFAATSNCPKQKSHQSDGYD